MELGAKGTRAIYSKARQSIQESQRRDSYVPTFKKIASIISEKVRAVKVETSVLETLKSLVAEARAPEPVVLQLRILSARGLPADAAAPERQWHCRAELLGRRGPSARTAAAPGERETVWNYSCNLEGYAEGDSILFSVWSEEESVGNAVLKPRDLEPEGCFEGELPLDKAGRRTTTFVTLQAKRVEKPTLWPLRSGRLHLQVLAAFNLRHSGTEAGVEGAAPEGSPVPSPYVVATVGEHRFETTKVKRSCNPAWDRPRDRRKVTFNVRAEEAHRGLHMEVCTALADGSEGVLGFVDIQIGSLRPNFLHKRRCRLTVPGRRGSEEAQPELAFEVRFEEELPPAQQVGELLSDVLKTMEAKEVPEEILSRIERTKALCMSVLAKTQDLTSRAVVARSSTVFAMDAPAARPAFEAAEPLGEAEEAEEEQEEGGGSGGEVPRPARAEAARQSARLAGSTGSVAVQASSHQLFGLSSLGADHGRRATVRRPSHLERAAVLQDHGRRASAVQQRGSLERAAPLPGAAAHGGRRVSAAVVGGSPMQRRSSALVGGPSQAAAGHSAWDRRASRSGPFFSAEWAAGPEAPAPEVQSLPTGSSGVLQRGAAGGGHRGSPFGLRVPESRAPPPRRSILGSAADELLARYGFDQPGGGARGGLRASIAAVAAPGAGGAEGLGGAAAGACSPLGAVTEEEEDRGAAAGDGGGGVEFAAPRPRSRLEACSPERHGLSVLEENSHEVESDTDLETPSTPGGESLLQEEEMLLEAQEEEARSELDELRELQQGLAPLLQELLPDNQAVGNFVQMDLAEGLWEDFRSAGNSARRQLRATLRGTEHHAGARGGAAAAAALATVALWAGSPGSAAPGRGYVGSWPGPEGCGHRAPHLPVQRRYAAATLAAAVHRKMGGSTGAAAITPVVPLPRTRTLAPAEPGCEGQAAVAAPAPSSPRSCSTAFVRRGISGWLHITLSPEDYGEDELAESALDVGRAVPLPSASRLHSPVAPPPRWRPLPERRAVSSLRLAGASPCRSPPLGDRERPGSVGGDLAARPRSLP